MNEKDGEGLSNLSGTDRRVGHGKFEESTAFKETGRLRLLGYYLTKALPEELVLDRIIFPFCTGETLRLLCEVCRGPECLARAHHAQTMQVESESALERDHDFPVGYDTLSKWARQIIPHRICQRITSISSQIRKDSSSGTNKNLSDVADWLDKAVAVFRKWDSSMVFKHEPFILYDFLQFSLSNLSDLDDARYEWPVWCGSLACSDLQRSGDSTPAVDYVLISCPISDPVTFFNRHPQSVPCSPAVPSPSIVPDISLVVEPYNMVPVPPWGRIVSYPMGCRRQQEFSTSLSQFLGSKNMAALQKTQRQASCENRNDSRHFKQFRVVPWARAVTSNSYLAPHHREWLRLHSCCRGDSTPPPLLCCWQRGDDGENVGETSAPNDDPASLCSLSDVTQKMHHILSVHEQVLRRIQPR
jgi:hypothetical protein